nr:MAG TPA: LAMBDA REPRESSOR (TRIPLE MUTANT)/DNA COMPLEX-DNA COMPLEX, DOUBLE HELIX, TRANSCRIPTION-DNA.1A [Caudoviricetes sp.]
MSKNRFRKHYDALPPKAEKAPKSAFVDEIAELCKVHPQTVRCWIYGSQKPDSLRRSLISKHLNIPEDELFDD